MKRSEIISIIDSELAGLFGVTEQQERTEKAKAILLALEEVGIQPPAIKEPCTTEVFYNGRYVKTEDSFIFTHKWDEEDGK